MLATLSASTAAGGIDLASAAMPIIHATAKGSANALVKSALNVLRMREPGPANAMVHACQARCSRKLVPTDHPVSHKSMNPAGAGSSQSSALAIAVTARIAIPPKNQWLLVTK